MGDQKPVAWHSPTDSVTPFVKPHIKEAMLPHAAAQYSVPLYLSPPPAAGWEDAIEAACKICSFAIGQTHNMSRMAMAEELRDAIEALRHNAPPDSGAGKSDDNRLPSGVVTIVDDLNPSIAEARLSPDHGGADAGVGKREALLRLPGDNSLPDFTGCNSVAVLLVLGIANILDDPRRPLADRELDAVKHAEVGLKPLLEAALSKPAPVAANASAEARLREALGHYAKEYCEGWCEQDAGCAQFDHDCVGCLARRALSTHPHASDCDKQETTKSEGWTGKKCQHCKGTGENLREDYPRSCQYCGGTGDEYGPVPDASRDGAKESEGSVEGHASDWQSETPSTSGVRSSNRGEAGIESGPSARTADVTETELAVVLASARRNAQGYGPMTQEETAAAHMWPSDSVSKTQARAILDAFTVGRR